MASPPHYPLPCTLEVRTLPDGTTTRTGGPFRFRAHQRDVIRVEIPGNWRGPDLVDATEPGQATWLCSGPVRAHLRSVWPCIWETDQDGFKNLLALLSERLSAPSRRMQKTLEALREGVYGEPERTLVAVDKILVRHAELAEFHFLRGLIFERLRDPERARSAFDRCVEVAPHHGEGWIRAGFVRLNDPKRHEESLACHRRAVAVLPRSSSAGYYLARQLGRMHRLEEAQAEMARTITLYDAAPPDTYMHRARWLHGLGRTEDAVSVLDDSPHHPETWVALRRELTGG